MFKKAIYAYTAGLFDGEGYLGIIKHFNKSGRISYGCTAEISNTNKEIIEWLLEIHGGIINEAKRKTLHSSNEKQKWVWILKRRNGLRTFLHYIQFYSIIKRDQIKLARQFMSGEVDGELAFQKMKELNHRGTQIPQV